MISHKAPLYDTGIPLPDGSSGSSGYERFGKVLSSLAKL
jgi:hypothetical protein